MKHSERLPETYLISRWQQLCKGDKSAFGEITEHNYAALYHYGTRFTADRDMIKDCLQDLFLEIWEKRESLSYISAIKPYLFQSLRNNLIHRVRRQSVFSEIKDNDPCDELSPESDWIINETDQLTANRLKKAIESLPKRQKEALYLKYYENLSYDEIASVMGLQRQAVANYLQYGIQKLREYLQHAVISLAASAFLFWY
ncbi:RNA polymerase sigma factor [Dyadobacter arcticus]|uniref:RNA polymerase sigma factor (Sigma-70 family) n=1 Tax=Dyadobacter arcticus TaxID=1078754 RepID=A0ABX0UIU3_9BACT|nr:sigma-70 family RNA polymerase sigma factor [Dyadobacter arcticus]NIJ51480.1 RNA polymerase sigma factor (sigma-70 family) [Dyadobacter arcticus]